MPVHFSLSIRILGFREPQASGRRYASASALPLGSLGPSSHISQTLLLLHDDAAAGRSFLLLEHGFFHATNGARLQEFAVKLRLSTAFLFGHRSQLKAHISLDQEQCHLSSHLQLWEYEGVQTTDMSSLLPATRQAYK